MGVSRRSKPWWWIGLILISWAPLGQANSSNLKAERKEDEIVLPPYLRQLEGGILNTFSELKADAKPKRMVRVGEWLDFGDAFSLPDRMAIQVFMNEGLQWVGGGVFRGKIAGGKWELHQPSHVLQLERGWLKVWVKPGPFASVFEIKTPKVNLVAEEATFWLSVTPQKTELYLLTGTVKADEWEGKETRFYEWTGASSKPSGSSQQWNQEDLEARIFKLYPGLKKIAHSANEDWEKDRVSKKYAELRIQGWKKTDRYFPTPIPQK